MEIKLYSGFQKRPNSTKLIPANYPPLTTATLECKLLDGTSIISPVITIEYTAVRPVITSFTYAYISMFNRYYFITNITSVNNLWVISLAVDVLASYRASIIASSQYVLRSSSAYDDNIVDTMYISKPITTTSRVASNDIGTGYVLRHITSGGEPAVGQVFYFNYEGRVPVAGVCFGIVGKSGVGANYYVCSEDNFIDFMSNVFTVIPSDMGNLADGLKKLLADLNQYIVSVVRLPVVPHTSNLGQAHTTVWLGSYEIPCSCYSVEPGFHFEEYEFVNDITLPSHPNISTHSYYAMPPYSSYVLDFLPLGSIPLDASKLYGNNSINVKWRVDYVSGLAWFKVGYYVNNTTTFHTLTTDICQVGIPIPLSQLKVDNLTGFGLSVANVLSDAFKSYANSGRTGGLANLKTLSNSARNIGQSFKDLGGAISRWWSGDNRKLIPASENGNLVGQGDSFIGNFVDLNRNVLDQVVDYAASILGDVVTKGSTGTYLNIVAGLPTVRAFFIGQAENDNARNGRPLHQIRTLNTLSGFCVCQNATIDFLSTDNPLPFEINGIINMLNSGIFIE